MHVPRKGIVGEVEWQFTRKTQYDADEWPQEEAGRHKEVPQKYRALFDGGAGGANRVPQCQRITDIRIITEGEHASKSLTL